MSAASDTPSFNPRQRLLLAVGAAVGVLLIAFGIQSQLQDRVASAPSSPAPQSMSAVSGQGSSDMPPWPAPTNVAERVEAAGMDLGPMGMAQHFHPDLQIRIGEESAAVPANIGVDAATGAMSALHTHTADGVIHIEADESSQEFTLGQFFTEWDVRLTPTQIGGVVAAEGERVRVFLNGDEVYVDPALLRLAPDRQIILEIG